MKEFEPATTAYSARNALALGRAADLAYEDAPAVKRALAGWGMTGTFIDAVDPPKGDTQAFVAADAETVILAFRGTKDVLDFLTDARFAQDRFGPKGEAAGKIAGRVHTGFLQALDVGWTRVRAAVAAARDRDQTLWATGHSLGAALATLAVARLRNEGVGLNGLYTFGSPAVGDGAFADSFDGATKGRVFRFVNDLDIVTRCPPGGVPYLPPYQHAGKRMFFDARGALADHPDPLRWASVVQAMTSIALKGGTVPREKLKQELIASLKEPLEDHAMAGYLRNLEAALMAPAPAPSSGGPSDLLGEIRGLKGLWGK